MRARLVVTSLIAGSSIGIALLVSVARAQTQPVQTSPRTTAAPPATSAPVAAPAAAPAQPTAAPPAPAKPSGAAPGTVPPPAATAAAAMPTGPSDPGAAPGPSNVPPEGFDLPSALKGVAPLTSDQAAKRAAETAPSVAKAEAAARRAALAAEQANVALYPRLDLTARYTLLSRVPPPAFAEALGPDAARAFRTQQHTGLFLARVTYPVSSLFFSIIPRYKAAQKSAEAQKLQSKVQAQTVALQAREAYYNYARARAGLMVAKSGQAQNEAHQKDVDALVNAGSLAKVELMRADARVAASKVAVSRTQGLVATARAALFTITHLEGNEDVTINEDLESELPALTETNDALLAKALANRTELRQLRISLEAIEHTVDAAQGAELPQLSIGGTAEYDNPNQRYFGAAFQWHESWAVFASLDWSPNDWQSNGKVAEQARADLAQTLADLESLEDALRIEVTQAYEDYNSARAALESSRTGIAAAEESYRVRREQFRAGAAVALDVIDAENDLQRARLDLVNAIIDMRIAKARLDRAVEAS
jgi:outer membrane protein